MGVLLPELVQLGLQPGQVVRHQRHADANAHRLGRLDLWVPASILQMHPDFILVADEEALSLI